MAARGRKPKPTALKLVEGNPGKRKIATKKAKIAGTSPIMPRDLTKEQAKIWRHAVRYAPHGLIKRIDTSMLLQWVIARAAFDEARRNYDAGPKLIKSGSGVPIQSPWLGIMNRQSDIMRLLSADLGFNPGS